MLVAEAPVRPPATNSYLPHVRDKSRWMVPLNPLYDVIRPFKSAVGEKGFWGIHESHIQEVDEATARETPGWVALGTSYTTDVWGRGRGFHNDTPEQLLREHAEDIHL